MARSIELSPFDEVVEEALKLARDVDKLGHDSLLAAPYILADYFDENDISARDRGRKLFLLLNQAIDRISGVSSERYKAILKGQYLQGRRIEDVMQDSAVLLSLTSKATYHENRKSAIKQLASILTEMFTPALRLEQPLQINRKLFSREWETQSCWQALQSGQTVAISGNGGVGKTSLVSHLANRWKQSNVFWFTIQPGINDHVQSIVFALGYFFRTLGEPILWQEMLPKTTSLAFDILVHLIRDSLQKLNQPDTRLLFCFDEVDRLDPATHSAHLEVISLLNILSREKVALLFVGHQPLLESQQSFRLEDLTLSATSLVLNEAGMQLLPAEVQQIYDYTNGNPRLLDLVVTLLAYGTPVDELHNEIGTSLPLQFFLNKIFLRLNIDEANLLRTLSVFRSTAPGDLWQKQENLNNALSQLAHKRLITVYAHGGVAVMPAYRDIIYDMLTPETLQTLHKLVAGIWIVRAAYTSAAYHLIQSGQSELAVLQWREHQQQEINQGQAYVAYELFHNLDTAALSQQAREQHSLLRAELARLIGNDRQALTDINSIVWNTPILAIKASIQEGIILNDEGALAEARQKFTSALELANEVIGIQMAYSHKGLSWSYFKEGELQAAWLEAQRAQHEVAYVQGVIQYEMMKWERAEHLFHTALSIAQEIDDQDRIANAANSLLILYSTLGKYHEAEAYANQAIQIYKSLGREQQISRIKTNLAMGYNLAGKHEYALQVLLEARKIVQSHQFQLPIEFEDFINLEFAEAYLGKEDWGNAEKYISPLKEKDETRFKANVHRIMGGIHSGRGDLATAIQWLTSAIEIIEQDAAPDPYFYAFTYRSRARVYVKAGEYQKAIDDKDRAIQIFTQNNLPHEIEKTIALLPELQDANT